MRYLKKVPTTLAVLLIVVFVTVKELSPTSNSGADQTKPMDPKDDAFYYGIWQAAAAYRIEKAMSQSQSPPLDLHIDDDDNNALVEAEAKKRILIVTKWRSGSTFLGDLINSYPGVFYSYEPFLIYERSKLKLIEDLFQCHFPADYLRQVNGLVEGGDFYMSRNMRAWSACLHDKSLCSNPDFVAKICSIYPIHLIKVVRLRVNELEEVFREEATRMDWKIIYLVRDPRGIMASRSKLSWCYNKCLDPSQHCSEVDDDLMRMEQLKRRYPNMFTVIKFEELTANVETETEKLFQFLALPVARSVQTFLDSHTSAEGKNNDPYLTYRNTKEIATQWQSKLSRDVATNVTEACKPLLKRLNYL